MKSIQILKVNLLSKNGVTIVEDIHIVLLNADKKQQDNKNRPPKHKKKTNKCFYQKIKNDQKLTKQSVQKQLGRTFTK